MAHVKLLPSARNERETTRAPSALGEHPFVIDERNNPTYSQHAYQFRGDVAKYIRPHPLAGASSTIEHEKAALTAATAAEQRAERAQWIGVGLAAVSVALAAYAILRQPGGAPPSSGPVVVMPPGSATPATPGAPVEEPRKKRRRRRTTQARAEDGSFLPAGTLAAPKTEGT
jgi:hypothetical protein